MASWSMTYTTVHDIRLRSMEDRDLRTAGVLTEEREVLASRAVLGRYSSFFRNILSTIPVGGAVSPWTLLSLISFHRLARLVVAKLPASTSPWATGTGFASSRQIVNNVPFIRQISALWEVLLLGRVVVEEAEFSNLEAALNLAVVSEKAGLSCLIVLVC